MSAVAIAVRWLPVGCVGIAVVMIGGVLIGAWLSYGREDDDFWGNVEFEPEDDRSFAPHVTSRPEVLRTLLHTQSGPPEVVQK
jgi:hypothetical protein